jgi:dihydrofolate reductase
VKGDLAEEVRKMKKDPGDNIAILGSGSIVSQLAKEGPIVLGKGRTLFDGVKEKVNLKRTRTRAFRNGNVLICYEPTA